MVETAKVFTNGGSQAVRLPKDFRFDTDEVDVNRIGKIVILVPKENRWAGLLQSLDMFTDDFMKDGRGDLKTEEREAL
ncbi:MAG: type II toxin-antitoxin system VapB family antitoxin [Lachnospiraceae bacterium]|jgi:antitoxin VapB|uniref:AbrB/MazE/SpoVT family DNA-binding domain-containing protein n=1 Tax=Porcincola intestinalis TaxID=2606632 RepID=A0A6L5X7N5_9FIRM|nr:type II toxin-antitoxin system VapB family antitoxin [Porcincola intestinalis]MCI6768363.1 type II toxin-antitoxin system VapB family antitoxin [Lachnospiraceae bacterium]MDY4205866.1 type II toxin-antitoxin system VapB family antitoxin [Porcincola intestinalis]MSS14874.1 AbrB/MazE/SpoVT family DNA-binding domain-containing protein [Porcincola intestinalis]